MTVPTGAATGKGKVLVIVMVGATLLLGGGTYVLGALGAKIGHADTSAGRKRASLIASTRPAQLPEYGA